MLNRMFFAQNVSHSIPVTRLGFGRLYNWYAALNPLLPPDGWHVATRSDWLTLYSLFGGLDQFGSSATIGGKLKSTNTAVWNQPNVGATNEIGLDVFGNGYRQGTGAFSLILSTAFLWGTRSDSPTWGWDSGNPSYSIVSIQVGGADPHGGRAIRMVKNDSTDPLTMTDYDGNVYNTVKIGTQIWTKENWKCTKYNDGTSIPNVTDSATWASLTTGAMCAYNNDENNV